MFLKEKLSWLGQGWGKLKEKLLWDWALRTTRREREGEREGGRAFKRDWPFEFSGIFLYKTTEKKRKKILHDVEEVLVKSLKVKPLRHSHHHSWMDVWTWKFSLLNRFMSALHKQFLMSNRPEFGTRYLTVKVQSESAFKNFKVILN